jgi:hypothetical protein
MNVEQGEAPFVMTEGQHKAIAHDLPIIDDLLGHHCIFIMAAYPEISLLAQNSYYSINRLLKEMRQISTQEYPNADWLIGMNDGLIRSGVE